MHYTIKIRKVMPQTNIEKVYLKGFHDDGFYLPYEICMSSVRRVRHQQVKRSEAKDTFQRLRNCLCCIRFVFKNFSCIFKHTTTKKQNAAVIKHLTTL